MAMKAPTTRTESFALLRDAVLARPTARGWIVPVFQLWLILVSHPAIVFLSIWIAHIASTLSSRLWHALTASPTAIVWTPARASALGTDALLDDLAIAVVVAPVAMILEAVSAWIPFRFVARQRRPPFSRFVRSWWRTCLWGYLVIPAGAAVFADAPHNVFFEALPTVALGAFAVFGPALFARRERPLQRLARWRPVCPECGYSLRRLRGGRCPECGVAFPTTSRVFRRWAVRRLIWERVQRGTVLFAYIKTVLTIVFWLCRAARGVAVPDRAWRAVRWASVHVVVLALAGVAPGSRLYFPQWVQAQFAGSVWAGIDATGSYGPTAGRVALWTGQSLGAWLITLAALPLLGVALGYAVPGRHPAASRGIAKWSLYLSTILVGVFVAAYALSFLYWLWFPRMVGGFRLEWSPPRLPVDLLAVPYGIWWAIGVSVNPYLRARGFDVFLIHGALFVLSWLVLTAVLFPAGAFGSLL